MVALDAKTGKAVWTNEIDDFKAGFSFSAAPLIVPSKAHGPLIIKGECFRIYIEHVFLPALQPGGARASHSRRSSASANARGAPVSKVTAQMFVLSDDRRVVKRAANLSIMEDTMKALTFIPALAVLCAIAVTGPAAAGKSIVEEGAQACVIDKWDVKEPEKGHKLVDYSGRCVYLPDDSAPKASSVCPGKFEYMPDGSYKAAGTCEITYAGGDKKTVTWEEGSHMKEKAYKNTGGTGRFAGATGGGTYTSENITDSTFFGLYKGKAEMP